MLPMMIQLFTIPGNNIRFHFLTREVPSCRSSTTPTPFVQTCLILTITRMVASILHGLTSLGPPTTFRLPSLTTTSITTTTNNNNNNDRTHP
jgi:hypothetical protein